MRHRVAGGSSLPNAVSIICYDTIVATISALARRNYGNNSSCVLCPCDGSGKDSVAQINISECTSALRPIVLFVTFIEIF